MAAPTWQYIVLMVIFTLGLCLNMASVVVMKILEEKKKGNENPLALQNNKLSFGPLLVKTLMSVFSAYLMYSLYLWAPGALAFSMLVVHCSTLLVGYILSISRAGEVKVYTYGEHFFGAFYALCMITALVFYGVQCL